MSKKKVVVALSGGVDSSVSAYLLKKKGYDVIGLFMKNWHDESVTISKECPWLQDSNDAMLIAQKLGIPFKIIDLSVEYKKRIVDYMFSEYKKGRTPNPDVICNREIKFDVFLKIALSMDADYVATGHYCQKKSFENSIGEQVNSLLSGVDKTKDQSYFLCQINQFQLQKVIFPIGGLKKNEVRKIAKEIGLVTADKKDSQGLCFIGKISLPEFLSQKLKPKEGKIIQIKDELKKLSENLYGKNFDIKLLNELSKKRRYKINEGEVIGAHKGAHFFTIGQRKGLSVGGHSQPLFVINTDVKNNLVYVGEGANHTGLFRRALKIKKGSEKWIRSDLTIDFDQRMDVLVRIRYRQPLQEAIIYKKKEGFFIVFKNHQSSITSGQFAAWYVGEELIGSGVIN
ncbi:MAG: tRNA 2-thiouridine(34) synthase MnmA [Flavobacteriaceae bacterium]|nr:tRNA 2-thiouridine(34) synthase MnmA [Flavobacteriaceae bacterium]